MNNIQNTQTRDQTNSIINTVHSQSGSRAEINIPHSQAGNNSEIAAVSKSKINILHSRFTEYGKNSKLWMRKCVLLLPEIAKNRVWEKKKFGSIYEYAAKLAGMSWNTVDDALRIFKNIEDKPALIEVVKEKGINAVRPVAVISTKEDEKFWAEKAKKMSRHTLETYVKEFRTGPGMEIINKTIIMQIKPKIADELEKMKGNNDWNELMEEFIKLKKEKLEAEKPESVEAASRYIPTKIKKFINKRSEDICEYPGCKKKAAILHHTDRFAISQSHDPDKIRALCHEHHDIAHHGLIGDEEKSPNTWRIKKYAYENNPFYEFTPKYEIDKIVVKKRTFGRRF